MNQELTSASNCDEASCTDNDHDSNSAVDAFAAVVLVVIFVATSIFWISVQ